MTLSLDPAGLTPGLGLGYTGIVVAALARLQPFVARPRGAADGGAAERRPRARARRHTPDVVLVLQGTVLLFVVGGQFLLSYRIARRRSREASS